MSAVLPTREGNLNLSVVNSYIPLDITLDVSRGTNLGDLLPILIQEVEAVRGKTLGYEEELVFHNEDRIGINEACQLITVEEEIVYRALVPDLPRVSVSSFAKNGRLTWTCLLRVHVPPTEFLEAASWFPKSSFQKSD